MGLLKYNKAISVVGTRKPNEYGMKLVNYYIRPLVKEWVIVSGLAKGIDGRAHQIAVEEKGKTIAVVAGGFDHLYPKEHRYLAEQIDLLISLYPPETKVQKWMFPERNRIISGLSFATLVIQASKRSGSLITAHFALEQGREVFSPPCELFDESFAGNLELIKDGATIAYSPKDMINVLLPMIKMMDCKNEFLQMW